MEFNKDYFWSKVQKKTNAVFDYQFQLKLAAMPWSDWLSKENFLNCRDEYIQVFNSWIQSSQLNRLGGLERFPIRHLIHGTTQTFDESYFKYSNRRLRVLPGEYAYHARSFKNIRFLTERDPLECGDWLIVSLPFCSTGIISFEMEKLLDNAREKLVPVIVDCAYFGTCYSIEFDFDHPAIESVSFSLSKGLGLGHIRSGIRYSRKDDGLMISQQNHYNHLPLCSARIGLYMMENFSPDYIPTKYMESQQQLCKLLSINPGRCVHIGYGAYDEESDFVIDGVLCRYGLREAVKEFYKSTKR